MDSTNALLLAEFFTATGYLDRLLYAFTELEKLHYMPRGKNQIQKLLFEFQSFIIKDYPQFNYQSTESEWSEFRSQIKSYHQFIEAMIKLPFTSQQKVKSTADYINLIYRNCFEIHNYILECSALDIQYPRLTLIQEENIPTINKNEDTQSPIPLFFLDEKKLYEYNESSFDKKSPLIFLDQRREEKYDQNVHKGHGFISQKNYEEAKEQFYKARNYRETAEVLTLIAWTYSLLNNRNEAKAYCLKAIQLDSQYGPAYNDYGNYILSEGLIADSLRWFDLAKRAYNYQNREYPYINAGRAYVLLKDYEKALSEFSLALTLAPQHQELHETVTRLKMSLDKSNSSYTGQRKENDENTTPELF